MAANFAGAILNVDSTGDISCSTNVPASVGTSPVYANSGFDFSYLPYPAYLYEQQQQPDFYYPVGGSASYEMVSSSVREYQVAAGTSSLLFPSLDLDPQLRQPEVRSEG